MHEDVPDPMKQVIQIDSYQKVQITTPRPPPQVYLFQFLLSIDAVNTVNH